MIKNKAVYFFSLNLFIAVLVSVFVIAGCSKKDGSTGDEKKSDSKSDSKSESFSPDKPFHVIFSISGASTGTVDGYYSGKKSFAKSEMEIAGMKNSATVYFNGGDTLYMISDMMGKKTGMKFAKNDFSKGKDQMDVYTFKDKLKDMDKIGSEEILGKQCDIYRAKDSSYSISLYKETVPLKFSGRGGKMVMVATKYEEDAKVDDSMFEPPKDINYIDASNMMKDMKNMKDPKNMENMKDKLKEMEDVMKNYKK
jgi:hypothetical protein